MADNIIVAERLKDGDNYIAREHLNPKEWIVVTEERHLRGRHVNEFKVIGISKNMWEFLGLLKLSIEDYIKIYCRPKK